VFAPAVSQVACVAGAILVGVLSLRMNDAAVHALGLLTSYETVMPVGGLAAGLEEVAAKGIVRRGAVLVWSDSRGNADGAPSIFPNLTFWECGDSSFHLEDYVDVPVATVDHGRSSQKKIRERCCGTVSRSR